MNIRLTSVAALIIVAGAPLNAQLGGRLGTLGQAKEAMTKASKAIQDLRFSEAEEQQLGADVSARLRERFGVVQDAAVHKYVTLVGATVAENSSRRDLRWTFIVLDTDGVNAFAAPGGFVHITRGALSLLESEAELAGVLGHEIGHVMARHTIRAIQKAKIEGALAKAATRTAFLQEMSNRLYSITLENSFDRGDEMESDKIGIALANDAGYSASGLGIFLRHLDERNKALTARSGVFSSHPEMKARIDEIARRIKSYQWTNTAMVQGRYKASISYTPVGIAQLGAAEPASSSGSTSRPANASGSGAFGVGGLGALGQEKSSTNTVASAGSRGVNPDRDARGGPNKGVVVVTVSAEELAEFRKGIV